MQLPAMEARDPVLFRELPAIRKIIQDETWLEGERRGCYVSPYDVVVRDNVCRVILQVGQQLRESIARSLPEPTWLQPAEWACVPEKIDFEI